MIQETGRILGTLLQEKGINVPPAPLGLLTPLEWLIRGEGNPDVLRGGVLNPHPGQYGTFGVFMGDNLEPVRDTGFFLVFPRGTISTRWLPDPSQEESEVLARLARRLQLNPRTISGGLQLQAAVYQEYDVYQHRTGICTTPKPLELEKATLIVVRKPLVEAGRLTLPRNLKVETVFLDD